MRETQKENIELRSKIKKKKKTASDLTRQRDLLEELWCGDDWWRRATSCRRKHRFGLGNSGSTTLQNKLRKLLLSKVSKISREITTTVR